MNQSSNQEFALRLCKIDNVNYTLLRAIKEIEICKQLQLVNHQNIARIFSAKVIEEGQDNMALQIIMELGVCTLQDVFEKRRRENKPYSED